MKKTVLILIFVFFAVTVLYSCDSSTGTQEKNDVSKYSGIKVTEYTANDFRQKTADAEKWAEKNVQTEESETYSRNESDILTIGDTSYLSVVSTESNGMQEIPSYQVEKISNGLRTILTDCYSEDSFGDFPVSVIKDDENTLLTVMGESFYYLSTWGDAGKIIVSYDNGDIEMISYSFTDDAVTDEMLAGRE